jgi:hypothetical protein
MEQDIKNSILHRFDNRMHEMAIYDFNTSVNVVDKESEKRGINGLDLCNKIQVRPDVRQNS